MNHTPRTEERHGYVLGHEDPELDRLACQGAFWLEPTRAFLQRAGLKPGMRVLDLGSGAGDVALIAAELVGPSGNVVGVERAPEAVARASWRVEQLGYANIDFIQSDIDSFKPEGHFDALIGRLVLMYLPEPGETLCRLSAHLHPGAVVAFQEFDMEAATSEPRAETFERGMDWIRGAFSKAQFPTRMGLQLHQVFKEAGLGTPRLELASRLEATPESPIYDYFAETIRSLLPLIVKFGLASAEEVAADSLAERVRTEVLKHNGIIVPPALIGTWARV